MSEKSRSDSPCLRAELPDVAAAHPGYDMAGHEVKTAHQMGWATMKNGELLALAVESTKCSSLP
jgi:hypothetical protein